MVLRATKLAADVRGDLMQFSMGAPTINREDILDLCDQFDALTAEVERLGNLLRRTEGERDECSEGAMETRAENERLRAALSEIVDLELEGDASFQDALAIADEALNPAPDA